MNFSCNPLLPAPEDHELDCDRRLNGPKGYTNVETIADYNEYCTLYRDYVGKREPFFRKQQLTGKEAELVVLREAIDKLANCNYVHNFGSKTRVIALYEYPMDDVVHDITDDRQWMFPTPGSNSGTVASAQVTTRYFESAEENYVPERGVITGPDPQSRVWLSEQEEPPHKRYGQAQEMCLSISKHPDTAVWYSSLLWAAVKGQ